MKNRIYKFDNIKTILIFLVVLGHLLELANGGKLLYLVIYSFHMPLFMFVTGYFACFDRKHIICQMVFPYLIFQILYTYFGIYLLGSQNSTLTFVIPYWLLWYLFAIIVYYLLIPFLDVKSGKGRVLIFAASVLAALLSGYDIKLGYDFSAARIFSFMPFFLAGFYIKREQVLNRLVCKNISKKYLIWSWCMAAIIIAGIVFLLNQGVITKHMLYGSYAFKAGEYNIWLKLLIMLIACIWIAVFLILVPDQQIPFLSHVGRYTMPVFLLHGFIVKLIGQYCHKTGNRLTVPEALLISVILLILLGNKYANQLFSVQKRICNRLF